MTAQALARRTLTVLILCSMVACAPAVTPVATHSQTPVVEAPTRTPVAMSEGTPTASPKATPTQPAPPSPTASPTVAAQATATAMVTASAAPTLAPATATVLPIPAGVIPPATPASQWQPGGPDAVQRLSRYYASGVQGTIVERWFYSPALDRQVPYDIYLPPDYETANRRYPVLYMLHGGGAHRDEWLGYGLIDVADPQMRNGGLQPMIIVFPQGDTGYWTDNAGGGPRWGEYLWRDVVGQIDAAYRTAASPRSRAVGGVSMGGWGALSNSFVHPDVFGVAGAHSPSLPQDNGFRPVLGTGEEFLQKDPISLASTAAGLNSLQIWIDSGQVDEWLPRINELHNALASRGIAHTWQVNPGVHDYTYWMKHTLDYLRFYSTALARP